MISPMRRARRDPEQRAEAVLLELKIATDRRIDVVAIARALGAEPREVQLSSELSGLLVRDGSRKVISYNAADPEVRQRFTIAHEIGHLLMHAGRPHIAETKKLVHVSKRETSRAYADAREEREANQFAAALLMPGPSVVSLWDRLSLRHNDPELVVRDLASTYGVSHIAMKWRVNNLGLYQFVED